MSLFSQFLFQQKGKQGPFFPLVRKEVSQRWKWYDEHQWLLNPDKEIISIINRISASISMYITICYSICSSCDHYTNCFVWMWCETDRKNCDCTLSHHKKGNERTIHDKLRRHLTTSRKMPFLSWRVVFGAISPLTSFSTWMVEIPYPGS
jgi:hypothetical protein